ncbi:MAG: DUF1285 domain-containing protein [bacterium]
MIDETLPDVVKNYLRAGHRLERIALDRFGRWTHEGLDFENPRVIDLFSRSVQRTEGGTWVLVIPPFTYPIEVERTGYFVTAVDAVEGTIALSDGTSEVLDLDTLAYEGEGSLYCDVKGGRFEARFLRHAYYALADLLEEHEGSLVLRWRGELHDALWAVEAQS